MSILFFIVGLAVAGGVAYAVPSSKLQFDMDASKRRLERAKEEAKEIQEKSRRNLERAEASLKDAEEDFEDSVKGKEELLAQKEDIVKRREDRNKSFEKSAKDLQYEREKLEKQLDEITEKAIAQLSKVSGLTREKALEKTRTELTELITEDFDKRMESELSEFQDDVLRHARAVLQLTIQRLGVPSSVDKNNTSVKIKDERFKGMLIGKGGKNIAYLESLLPISVIFNNGGPDVVYVGGLNLLRRNIAKKAIEKMQKLVLKKKKTVTHEMIKAMVDESEAEIMATCDRKGKWAAKQLGLDPEKIDPELVNYIGRMYYRTSYGQNIIHHSLEMAYAARIIAELIGADVDTSMQAAFYHDIGKAIDHDIGGAHDDISKDILEKHNYSEGIVHAAYAHHDKVPCETPPDFIVKAVDAISGGRPGARMESVFNYFERMQQLVDAASFFKGVQKVFTMSAGREVRVMVNKDQIKDDDMSSLAENIAGKISEDVAFPGIIKVNLIRRTKSVDYAREKSRR